MSKVTPNDYEKLAEEAGTYLDAGNLERRIALLEQASMLAGSSGETRAQGALLNNLALAQKHAGQTNDARKTQIRAVDLLRRIDAQAELAEALRNLGFIERDLGNLDAARQDHEAAFATFETLSDSLGMARALIDLGLEHKDQIRLTEARASFEHALALLADQDTPRFKAHALVGLGLTMEKQHDIEGAHQYYLEALKIYRGAGDRENEALTLHNFGQLYDNQGQFQIALEYYRQSLEINLAIHAKWGVVENLTSLAAIYQVTADPDQARQLHKKALHLQEEIGDRRGQMWTLCDLGIIARDAGHLDEAQRYLNAALMLANKIGDPDEMYEVHFNLGDMHLLTGQLHDAARNYADAVDALESVRHRLLLEEEALSYFDEPHLEVYDRLVRLYVSGLSNPIQALVWEEKAKAREFLRRLSLTEIARSRRTPKDLIDRETQLLTQLHQTAAIISIASEPSRLAAVRAYESVEVALHTVWTEIKFFDPEYVTMRRGEPASWEEIQKCLRPTWTASEQKSGKLVGGK
jgi:tetratricopeptide (TPR) repeat protein